MSTKTTIKEKRETTSRYQFAPQDKSIPYRTVGSYEYVNAIEKLETLVRKSNSEELAAYDRFLDERPEFTYFNGLAENFGLPTGDLTRHNQFDGKQFNKRYKQQGLAAMMALAKVEVGATMSMYGKSKQPFNEFGPLGEFDLRQMIALIADDVQAHLQSLDKEKKFKKILNRPPNSATLSYLRRLKLIQDMIAVLKETDTLSQLESVAKKRRKLKQYQMALVSNIINASKEDVRLKESTRTSTRKGGFVSEATQECQDYLDRIGVER